MRNEVDVDQIRQHADQLIETHRKFMQRLVEARKQSGLSQDEVAYRMGTSQSNVSTFERYDSNPTLSTIRRYALAIGAQLRSDVLLPVAHSEWQELNRPAVSTIPEPTPVIPISANWISSERKNIHG